MTKQSPTPQSTQQDKTTKNVKINNVKNPDENYQACNGIGKYNLEY